MAQFMRATCLQSMTTSDLTGSGTSVGFGDARWYNRQALSDGMYHANKLSPSFGYVAVGPLDCSSIGYSQGLRSTRRPCRLANESLKR